MFSFKINFVQFECPSICILGLGLNLELPRGQQYSKLQITKLHNPRLDALSKLLGEKSPQNGNI